MKNEWNKHSKTQKIIRIICVILLWTLYYFSPFESWWLIIFVSMGIGLMMGRVLFSQIKVWKLMTGYTIYESIDRGIKIKRIPKRIIKRYGTDPLFRDIGIGSESYFNTFKELNFKIMLKDVMKQIDIKKYRIYEAYIHKMEPDYYLTIHYSPLSTEEIKLKLQEERRNKLNKIKTNVSN